MNKKNFKRLALIAVMGLTVMACSQSEDIPAISEDTPESTADGMYHYTMYLNCAAPDDAGSTTTRAVTKEWPNNAVLYLRYKNGSSYVAGKATYNKTAGSWNVNVPSSLPTTSSAACEVYYFENAGSESGNSVTLNESTCCFFTTSATYKHPSSSAITVNATLGRKTWRLRFKGTSYTTITLPSGDNEVNYFTAFDTSTGVFSTGKKQVSLTVASNGYTPYVYGTFSSTSGGKITVTNGNQSYYRTITASNLAVGESGCLTIPTESSYSGWTPIDPNATIVQNFVVLFTDGIAMDWKLGSTVSTFDYTVFKKTAAEALTDDELCNEIYDENHYDMQYADYDFKSTSSDWYTPDTEYYLCAVAKNSKGQRGPVLRYLFRTKAESLPYASISNIKAASTTKWTYNISLKNNAKSYYLGTNSDEDTYNSDWHWFAYTVNYWASTNQIESIDWESVESTLSSGTCKYITICTWGVGPNGSIGNANVGYGSTASSRQWRASSKKSFGPENETMPKANRYAIKESTRFYKIQ